MNIIQAIIGYIAAAAMIVAGIAITYGGLRLGKFVATYIPPPPKWSIVCNDQGRYSFISFDGEVDSSDFLTRVEAEDAMEKRRIWHIKYNEDLAAGMMEQKRKAEARRNAAFKPCP